MRETNDPKARPGGIIVPGADAPTDETRSPEARRIILPPGTLIEENDDLPEFPKLRPLVLVPFSDGKRELVLVNDPLGVIPDQPVLSIESLALLQLLDGSLSMNDITAALTRESKDLRVANMVRDFVAQLDRLMMLETPRFDAAYRELRESYHALEIRPAALEGRSYPGEREALGAFLDRHFDEAERAARDAGETLDARAVPRALLAPHLDPRRAGAVMARAYLEVGATDDPLRVVIFGTGHSLAGDSFALTRKHFETAFGKALCDTAFVDAMAARLGDAAFHGELAHRDEHSIEFQVLYLQRRLGGRPFTIVPILCGGFHALLDDGETPREDPSFEGMLAALAEAERQFGGATLHVAGVDFSHVGTRFGDPAVDAATKERVEAFDRAAIDAAVRGNADAWFESIATHEDSTRICGWAPTYALLRIADPGPGRLLRYEQFDEPDASMVSVASIVWR